MESLLDGRRRQRLPTRLALSSIDFDGASLTVTAVNGVTTPSGHLNSIGPSTPRTGNCLS